MEENATGRGTSMCKCSKNVGLQEEVKEEQYYCTSTGGKVGGPQRMWDEDGEEQAGQNI